MLGTITEIVKSEKREAEITIKLKTKLIFTECYHPEYFTLGSVNIVSGELDRWLIEGNTKEGKGYYAYILLS